VEDMGFGERERVIAAGKKVLGWMDRVTDKTIEVGSEAVSANMEKVSHANGTLELEPVVVATHTPDLEAINVKHLTSKCMMTELCQNRQNIS